MFKSKWEVEASTGHPIPKEVYRQRVKRLHKFVEPIAEKQNLSVTWDSDGVTVQPKFNYNYEAFSIVVEAEYGYLIPDGWSGDSGGPNFCDPCAWKGVFIDALMQRVELDPRSNENLRYARTVFTGEIIHPNILAAIQ